MSIYNLYKMRYTVVTEQFNLRHLGPIPKYRQADNSRAYTTCSTFLALVVCLA